MRDARTWALVENLSNLDQMESRRQEMASHSSLMATHYRVISVLFFAHAEASTDLVLKQLDLIEAGRFERLAELEEGLAARSHHDLSEIANLKRATLTLLQRSQS